ncbi:MAG: transglycosylase domain-containing protein [Candidatus Ornithomonoglobus sp.]
MADYSRRNRGLSDNRNNDIDDFDWDAFDRQTSRDAGEYRSEEPIRRRRTESGTSRNQPAARRAAGDAGARRVNGQRASGSGSYGGNQPSGARKKKRKKKLTEKQIMFRKRVRTVIIVALLVCIVICSGMFVGMYAAVSREIRDMNIENLALNYTSTIYYYDRYGNEQELTKIHSDQNRIWVDSDAISQTFKDAIVSIEDERFYKHNGVDLKRTIGATVKYVAAKIGIGESNYGGSTITQQVIKNITKEDDFKATRKIKEMMRAIALERQLTKDEILTMYCNIVYFANNCNGVEAAARTYFNKSASELNLQEAASIAGITQYPSEYDPLAHPDKNVEKRNTVLSKMYELGKISETDYNAAAASPLETSSDYRDEQQEVTSYFEDQVVNDVIKDLINQKQYSEDFATSQVYNGGLKIYATIDTDIQDIMEDVFENTSNFPYGTSAESAMVIIDPYTGQVKGLIGGLGEKTDIRGFNRATQAVRQPGSAIKPLSVYGPAIDMGDITEMDIVTDEAIEIGYDNWKPKNSYSGFKGDMTIKEAVARSSNIPAVKVLDTVGLSNSFGYLQNKFHLSTITDGDKNYSSLALGGLTQGVTVKEMAAAYGVFVNSGKYITPYTYTQVLDGAGNVILQNNMNESQAMSESAAYITADLLSGPVNLSYGTATRARLSCGMPAYGKTGTTDDDFDKWFVGFTPYYVGACWFGFDSPSSLSASGISGNPCVTAWNLVFDRISKNQDYMQLTVPSSVVQEEVCSISGELANNTCDAVTAYFVAGTQPKTYCSNHYNIKQSSEFEGHGTATSEKGADTEAEKATPKAETSGGGDAGGGSAGTSADVPNAGSSGAASGGSGAASGGGSASGGAASGGAAPPYTGGTTSGSGAAAPDSGAASGGGAPAADSGAASGGGTVDSGASGGVSDGGGITAE